MNDGRFGRLMAPPRYSGHPSAPIEEPRDWIQNDEIVPYQDIDDTEEPDSYRELKQKNQQITADSLCLLKECVRLADGSVQVLDHVNEELNRHEEVLKDSLVVLEHNDRSVKFAHDESVKMGCFGCISPKLWGFRTLSPKGKFGKNLKRKNRPLPPLSEEDRITIDAAAGPSEAEEIAENMSAEFASLSLAGKHGEHMTPEQRAMEEKFDPLIDELSRNLDTLNDQVIEAGKSLRRTMDPIEMARAYQGNTEAGMRRTNRILRNRL